MIECPEVSISKQMNEIRLRLFKFPSLNIFLCFFELTNVNFRFSGGSYKKSVDWHTMMPFYHSFSACTYLFDFQHRMNILYRENPSHVFQSDKRKMILTSPMDVCVCGFTSLFRFICFRFFWFFFEIYSYHIIWMMCVCLFICVQLYACMWV